MNRKERNNQAELEVTILEDMLKLYDLLSEREKMLQNRLRKLNLK